jgi:plasmid maintenance system antidote protein VapI
MTNFEELVEKRIIEPYEVSREEIAYLLGVARRDLKTGKAVSKSNLDWAFAITYNSILQLSVAYMN